MSIQFGQGSGDDDEEEEDDDDDDHDHDDEGYSLFAWNTHPAACF